jgi:hypothetical protein
VNVQYDKTLDVLVVEVTGDLSASVYDQAIDAVLTSPSFRPNINVIYDLRTARAVFLRTDEIRSVSNRAKNLGTARGTSWKAAIVVSGILEYGLGRMFEFFNEDAPYKVRVFRSMEEARTWIAPNEIPS